LSGSSEAERNAAARDMGHITAALFGRDKTLSQLSETKGARPASSQVRVKTNGLGFCFKVDINFPKAG